MGVYNYVIKNSRNPQYIKEQFPIHSKEIKHIINNLNGKKLKLPIKVNFNDKKIKNDSININYKNGLKKKYKNKLKKKLFYLVSKLKHNSKCFSFNNFWKFDDRNKVNRFLLKKDKLISPYMERNKFVYLKKNNHNNHNNHNNPILQHRINKKLKTITSKLKYKVKINKNGNEIKVKFNENKINENENKINENKVKFNENENENIGKYAIKLDKTLLTAIHLHHDFKKAHDIAKQLDNPFRNNEIIISLDMIKISKDNLIDNNYFIIK